MKTDLNFLVPIKGLSQMPADSYLKTARGCPRSPPPPGFSDLVTALSPVNLIAFESALDNSKQAEDVWKKKLYKNDLNTQNPFNTI